ncbi:MAG TPA: 16S rRNA (guanine(527)-N(7))-methyltransferase RsmG [Chloroflexota bacterium]|nr:16S rRNA (guanine(527)-N(7))-methyltransferase RsmG [Chloroflexota bacterium]
MDIPQLVEAAARLGVALTAVQQTQFELYLNLLLAWNERLNLTAVRDPQAIIERHFYDSLTCAAVTGDLNGRALIDIGSGAGFPGLPLKIAFPQLQLTLVESIAKKTAFLQAVVTELGLTSVQILAERAEILGHQPTHRARYDWAVARAVADMRVLAEYLLPFCRLGGSMLAQKGENAAAETAAAAHAIHILGGSEAHLHPMPLPGTHNVHYLVVVEKCAPTPEPYPRRPGMAAKRPLGD